MGMELGLGGKVLSQGTTDEYAGQTDCHRDDSMPQARAFRSQRFLSRTGVEEFRNPKLYRDKHKRCGQKEDKQAVDLPRKQTEPQRNHEKIPFTPTGLAVALD